MSRTHWWCAACQVGGIDWRPRCWFCGSLDVTPNRNVRDEVHRLPDVGFQRSSP